MRKPIDDTTKYTALRKAMEAAGMTHQDVADRMYLTRSALGHKLEGRILWKLDEAYAILDILRVPHDQMTRLFPRNGDAS